MSARDIAKALESSSSTVRKRIRGMEQAGIMRVVAVTDFAAAGFDLLLAIGIEVENRNAEAVGRGPWAVKNLKYDYRWGRIIDRDVKA